MGEWLKPADCKSVFINKNLPETPKSPNIKAISAHN